MTHRALIALSLLLASLAPPALAQTQPCFTCPSIVRTGTLPTFIPTIYEGANAWFDPAYNGQGWSFTELIAPPGQPRTGVGVTYTYETDGRPTWLLLQGSWQRETGVRALLDGAPIAVLSGPVFDGLGGACPTCPFTNPSIAQRRYQQAEVIFHRPDVATVKLDGQVALGGEGGLVPAELVLVRGLPDLLAGTWRFTQRIRNFNGTYQERNFDTHGCTVSITRVSSPTTLNQFNANPASVPFWLPPSGSGIEWLRIDNGITCAQPGPGTDDRPHIAVVSGSRTGIRAINLNSLTPVNGTGGVESYTVSRTSRWMEIYVQGPDSLILRNFIDNNPAVLEMSAEFLLTRAP